MDRLTQLRGAATGSQDTTLDSSAASEAYLTANESSKYYSLSEEDSSFDISPIKDVSLASTIDPDKNITGNDQFLSNLPPLSKKSDLLDSYKFGKQIEAANILSGGVDIFDDNDNSYDGDELVIDDNVEEDDKSNPELKLIENTDLPKPEETVETLHNEPTEASKDTEVVLQIDGNNVIAIDIGNGLYLYRKAGEEELAAVQVISDDHGQTTFKFLKVRENAEGNLEVYEEIEIEVPEEVPTKEGKTTDKNASRVPIKDINKVLSDPLCNNIKERKKPPQEILPTVTKNDSEDSKTFSEKSSEKNSNGRMKFNETRKSPVIHSTPNKEGIPLTKTMVDLQLHPNRQLDNVKTIEVHTDNIKPRITDIQTKIQDAVDTDKPEATTSNIENEKPMELSEAVKDMNAEDVKQHDDQKSVILEENEKSESSKIIQHTEDSESIILLKDTEKDTVERTVKIDEKKEKNLQLDQEKSDTVVKKDSKSVMAKKGEDNYFESVKCTTESTQPAQKDLGKPTIGEAEKEGYDMKVVESISNIQNQSEKRVVEKEINNEELIAEEIAERTDSEKSKEIDKVNKIAKVEDNNITTKPQKIDLKSLNQEDKAKAKSDDQKVEMVLQDAETPENLKYKTPDSQEFEPEKQFQGHTANMESSRGSSVVSADAKTDNIALNKPKSETKQNSKPDNHNHPSIKELHKINETENKNFQQIKQSGTTIIKGTSVIESKKSESEKDTVKESEKDTVNLKENDQNKKTKPETELTVAKTEKPQIEITKQVTSCIEGSMESQKKNIQCDSKIKGTVDVHIASPQKLEIKSESIKVYIDKKPSNNNNAAVPFGKWTEANRQEFLNKIKEAKVPISTSNNTKQIKQANDLNRRDVLQKIDSQRQSNNASSKSQELAKQSVKNETTFVNKPAISNPSTSISETKVLTKSEAPVLKNKPTLLKISDKSGVSESSQKLHSNSTVTSAVASTKSDGLQRKEINNQDLIDKTIEGIINRAVSTKPQPISTKETIKNPRQTTTTYRPKEKKPSIVDDIEMKMNELHGIPFVERPPHELPKVHNRDVKTYSKADNTKLSLNKDSKPPILLPVPNLKQQKVIKDAVIDLDSDEEIIEHEPVTGDIDLHKKNLASIIPTAIPVTNVGNNNTQSSKKEKIITEKDFDKFVRRNSLTYESSYPLRHNTEDVTKKSRAADDLAYQLNEDKAKITKPKSSHLNNHPSKIQTSKLVPVSDDAFNKNYQSKLQMAYQNALTVKRQMESPITIIEDKPVKVMFLDSNIEFPPDLLNVQGRELSPNKKIDSQKEPNSITASTCDSLDSEVLDAIDTAKVQDETKVKTKHQRKQVLTPVETPELELIVPGDLGLDVSPKKKRRIEDTKYDKSPKSLVPKKSYLLGRSALVESSASRDLTKAATSSNTNTSSALSHKDTASAIDNLVKAAELLETQSGNFKSDTQSTNSSDTTVTPIKRGRGRPRKYPVQEEAAERSKPPSPQKQKRVSATDATDESSDGEMIKENWTMGKINENIVCPICNKLFRSENVVYKHVKHCTGPSPSRSDSDKQSPRRLRLSHDSKSIESKFDFTDEELDPPVSKKNTPEKLKSKESSFDGKADMVVIEDTPDKNNVKMSDEPKQNESKKPIKTKAQYKGSTLSCDQCGKSFRQLSYLVSHKLLHKKPNPKIPEKNSQGQTGSDKSVFCCEICNKDFRKLHHLVQHRLIHSRPSRKSSSEHNVENKINKEQEIKQNEDQSAAFRCEPCDKSFRKLHHLVEHRETHDGINRQKTNLTTQITVDKANSNPTPKCDVCQKTFRKLHHLIEHKEQHVETSSEKSDDKSVKSSLSTKDIIHECSLCYMVFPNEHSLNKHSVFCQKKKRKSATKQPKPVEEIEIIEQTELPEIKERMVLESTPPKPKEKTDIEVKTNIEIIMPNTTEKEANITVQHQQSNDKIIESIELPIKLSNRTIEEPSKNNDKVVPDTPIAPQKIKKTEMKSEEASKTVETAKKKTHNKMKETSSVTKPRKSNLILSSIKESAAVESSDDDEIRYMLNPDYEESLKTGVNVSTSEGTLFMKVRAKKRNSLQFEKPNSKDPIKRRTSLQHPPKIPRLKPKVVESKNTPANPPTTASKSIKLESVPSTDSDDSDIKYSFPEKTYTEPENRSKDKRKSLLGKRKSLSGIAKRKSLGKVTTPKSKQNVVATKEVKKRRGEVEHRCDCGQLFSSAALLARHTSLAHTPPRVRRRRAPSPSPPAPKPKPGRPAGKATPVRKSLQADRAETPSAPSGVKPRKSTAHRGVPMPEKMKKLTQNLKK